MLDSPTQLKKFNELKYVIHFNYVYECFGAVRSCVLIRLASKSGWFEFGTQLQLTSIIAMDGASLDLIT